MFVNKIVVAFLVILSSISLLSALLIIFGFKKTFFCGRCGNRVFDEDNYCSRCGAYLLKEENKNE